MSYALAKHAPEYGDALNMLLVIFDDVQRLVSSQFDAGKSQSDLYVDIANFLASLGCEIPRYCVDLVRRRVDAPKEESRKALVYRVKHRPATYRPVVCVEGASAR